MASLPTGTVTFLFTDIEGSTRIWEREPDRMRVLLAQHDDIVRRTVEKHGGHVFKTIGDAFCVAFHDPLEAADAAIETQQELLAAFTDFRVRAAIYTGPAVETDGDYFGPAVNRVARLLSAGHGGQILVDGASAGVIGEAHREDARLRLLGEHRLRDLQAQEKVFQVVHPELPEAFPPLNTLDIAFRRGVVRAVAVSGVVILALAALTLVAISQKQRADQNADRALQGERRAIRGEKNAVLNAAAAHRESDRANKEERAAKAAAEQRRLALGVAVRERNKATLAAEKERLAKLAEAAQKLVALYQKAEAGKQRDLALTQLLRFHIANGDRFLESGGPVAGLPWYQRVLEITRQAGKPDRNARIRLAAILRNCPKLQRLLPHSGPITQAAFSPNGDTLATITGLATLRFWEVRTGTELGAPRALAAVSSGLEFSSDGKRVLTGIASPFFSNPVARLEVHSVDGSKVVAIQIPAPGPAAFSPDSRFVVAGSEEGFAVRFDVSTGKEVEPRFPHPGRVTAVAYLRGTGTLITGCEDGRIRFWETRSGRITRTLDDTGTGIAFLRVTPQYLLAGTLDGRILIWAGEGRGEGAAPDQRVNTTFTSIEVSPRGNRFATSDYLGRSARVWDALAGTPLTPPLLHPAGVTSAVFNPGGTLLATSCDDGASRLWDAETGAPASPPVKLSAPCLLAQFSPDGGSFLTGTSDGSGRLWSGELPQPYEVAIRRPGALSAGLFTVDGARVVTTGRQDLPAVVSDARSGRQVGDLPAGQAPWSNASLHDGGRVLITTGARRSIRAWDAATLRPLSPLLEKPEPPALGLSPEDNVVSSIALSPDRRRLYADYVVASGLSPDDASGQESIEDRGISAWDLSTGQERSIPIALPQPLRIASFLPNGRAVLLGGRNGAVRLYRLPDGAPLSREFVIGKARPVIRHSPIGPRAVLLFRDPKAEIWDLLAGRRLAVLRHREPIISAEYSPDGKRVLTAAMDGTARIWNAETGQPTAPPLAHPGGWVVRAAFSPDGTQVVTVGGVIGDRGEARLWDSRTGEALSPLLEHPRTIRSAAFSPDGTRIVTTGVEGQARIWNVEPAKRPLAELARLSTLLSGIRFAADGSPEAEDGSGLLRLFRRAGYR